MRKLTLTVGVPASGKSTWAAERIKESGVFEVNRDTIRQDLFGPFKCGEYNYSKEREVMVTKASIDLTLYHFNSRKAKEVIVSDTNINSKTRELWKSVAESNGWQIEKKLFHISHDVAIQRDNVRSMPVGAKVMNRMFLNYHRECRDLIVEHFKNELQDAWSRGGSPCVVSDIDGTVADMHNGVTGKRSPFEWERVGEDTPRYNVIEGVRRWSKDHKIIFLSGRDGSCRNQTRIWLDINCNIDYTLSMRRKGDSRPDWIIKLELLLQLSELGYAKPTVMFDDRQIVVDTMRSVGVEVWQVQPGNF